MKPRRGFIFQGALSLQGNSYIFEKNKSTSNLLTNLETHRTKQVAQSTLCGPSSLQWFEWAVSQYDHVCEHQDPLMGLFLKVNELCWRKGITGGGLEVLEPAPPPSFLFSQFPSWMLCGESTPGSFFPISFVCCHADPAPWTRSLLEL